MLQRALTGEEVARIEAFRAKVRAMVFAPMTAEELEEHQARFAEGLHNSAIEGIYPSVAERAIFAILDDEFVPCELRPQLLREYFEVERGTVV